MIEKNKYLYGRRNKFVKRKEKFQLHAIHIFTSMYFVAVSLFAFVSDTHAAEIKTNSKSSFIYSLNSCIKDLNKTIPKSKQIPSELIVAQAVIETAWGKSRISDEANNLFGIRTWNQEDKHLIPLPKSVDPTFKTVWPGWGVKVYETKCDSVKDYMRIINEVFAYAEFREMRGDGGNRCFSISTNSQEMGSGRPLYRLNRRCNQIQLTK